MANLWALEPLPIVSLSNSDVPGRLVDSLLESEQQAVDVQPFPVADQATFLRRVTFDLIGLPPTVEEQEAFLDDASADAMERVVDRLLASPQHGVRYGRHWLDVLRYADVDERMPGSGGLYLWRDWVIRSLNRNTPYDAFVRAQITGYETRERTAISATGYRSRKAMRPENQFALGFLARGATSRGNADQGLGMAAAETISLAFQGMTLHCAKCHDHFYDPISQEDYYRTKALFDPLLLREVPLATADQVLAYGDAVREYEAEKAELDQRVAEIEGPYRQQLYDERVAMLPEEIQRIIRLSVDERTVEEQKIADDYYPVLRIDVSKMRGVMSEDVRKRYDAARAEAGRLRRPSGLPSFLTVAEDAKRLDAVSYVLNTGDAARPIKERPVEAGFLFQPEGLDFRDGLRETFVDWLTEKENGLFARVAVNRIWQWHFGKGLHRTANDFGSLTPPPRLRSVLDGLAAAFVARGFDMKWLHKEIVLSAAYRRASATESPIADSNRKVDPENGFYWRFPLRRLEAEPIRDALLALAGKLDLAVGGPSFVGDEKLEEPSRRAAYLKRGYRTSRNELPAFLAAFDAEDGKAVCARREVTVTAPQALWMMNNPLAQAAADAFGARLAEEAGEDWVSGIQKGYRAALGREATPAEVTSVLDYLADKEEPFSQLAWLLFNLDEFVYVR